MGGTTPSGQPFSESGNGEMLQSVLSNPSLPTQLADLTNATNNPNAPKAHLNYLWFDDNLQLQTAYSGSFQVVQNTNGTGGWVTIGTSGGGNLNTGQAGGTNVVETGVPVPGNGLLVVYIDNQSVGKDVWFDNLTVDNYSSDVVEEDHYYPFGLTLNTSEMSTGVTKNDIKFQSQKHETDFGIDLYSFKYREHDPTIGRFLQVDPLSEKYVYNSTYAFCENKVTSYKELEGLELAPIGPSINKAWSDLKANFQSLADAVPKVHYNAEAGSIAKDGSNGTKTKVVVSNNASNWMNFLTTTNSNQGGPSFFNIDFSTESFLGQKVEMKTPAGSVSGKVEVNQKGDATATAEVTVNTADGKVGASIAQSSDGSTKVSASFSVETKAVTVKAEASATFKPNAPTGFAVGLGVEKDYGNRTYSLDMSLSSGD